MKTLSILLLMSFAFSANCQTTPSDTTHPLIKKTLLEGGSTVLLKLLNEISSKTAKEGEQISFAVNEDVPVGKTIIIKAGTVVTGNIEKAEKAKGLGKAGEISYSLNYAKAVDESKIYLRTTRAFIQGQDRSGGAVALAVVISPLFLLHKGKDVKMEAGKIVQAYTDRDYTIEIAQ